MGQAMGVESSPEINDVSSGIAASDLRQNEVPMVFSDEV